MHRGGVHCVVLVVCAYALLGTATSAFADCSKESLKGAYGFSLSGTNYIHDVAWAFVGRFESDGAGTLTGRGVQSAKGQISRPEFKGTYQIEADCSASAALTFPQGTANIYFVVLDNGKRLEMIVVDPGILEFGSATKIASDGTARTTVAGR